MSTGKNNVKTIEVFRPGTFTPMNGAAITFSTGDLVALAGAYDPDGSPAPAVVGHPTTDSPAYGWAKGFRFDDATGRLMADLGDLAPSFVEAVNEGRYKRVSMSLFKPDAANNPKPGSYYPKHIGFLGGAAPAVSGLQPVTLAADDADTATFEFGARAFKDVASVLRGVREFLIDQFGLEKADQVIPDWEIKWIDDAGDPEPETIPDFVEPTTPQQEPTVTKTPEALAAEFAEREARIATRTAELDARDNADFAEGLIKDGKLLPALKDKVVTLLGGIDAEASVSFAGDDGKQQTTPARDLLKDILTACPKVVEFGATDLGKEPSGASVDFASPDGRTVDPDGLETTRQAKAYQAQHPGTDFLTAVNAVQSR